jgi:hypothetical protein
MLAHFADDSVRDILIDRVLPFDRRYAPLRYPGWAKRFLSDARLASQER